MDYNHSPAVTLSKLRIRYQEQLLFDQFELHLKANQWSCLLGPSGIGKTTILRFIAGLVDVKEGECSGKIITSDNQPLKGRVSYLTQQDSLLPWLNILDNLLLGFYLRQEKVTSSLRQGALNLLEKVNLVGVSSMKPHQLSSGMRQRVALVRALLEDREVLLLDEPFSALDSFTRFKLQNLAATLLVNRTVLLVTHDPLEALRLGHEIYILAGSPATIKNSIQPLGVTPREVADPVLLEEQARLLKMLTENGV